MEGVVKMHTSSAAAAGPSERCVLRGIPTSLLVLGHLVRTYQMVERHWQWQEKISV